MPIPGNDDALRAIGLYCDLVVEAVLDGIQREMTASGVDLGAQAEPLESGLPADGADGEEAGAAPATEDAAAGVDERVETAEASPPPA